MHRVDRVVVHASSSSMGATRQDKAHLLVRILLLTFCIFMIAPVLIMAWVMKDIMSSGNKSSSDHGLLEQVLGYWFGIKLWDPSRTPIRNSWVQEAGTHRMWLVRMYGQLCEGDIARVDTVTIFADYSNGTLICRDGYYHTNHSTIIVG